MSKYNRTVLGLDGVATTVDVYRVLDAFNVTDPALQHLVKKALCVGLRGHKDKTEDLNDILLSANKAVELNQQKVQNLELYQREQRSTKPSSNAGSRRVSRTKA